MVELVRFPMSVGGGGGGMSTAEAEMGMMKLLKIASAKERNPKTLMMAWFQWWMTWSRNRKAI